MQHVFATTALNNLVPKVSGLFSKKSKHKFLAEDTLEVPLQDSGVPKRRVITLDCDMVQIGFNTSVLAQLSVIEYPTRDILIESLVQPLHPVTDWRTPWSVITAHAMSAAIASNTALNGAPAVRERLFDFIDKQTVIVGHALHHDFAALGIRHQCVVDSAKLAQNVVGLTRKDWGLKALCKEILGTLVQNYGNKGHDSVEDTSEAREVVLWYLEYSDELKALGTRMKDTLKKDKFKKAKHDAKRSEKVVPVMDNGSDDFEAAHLSSK